MGEGAGGVRALSGRVLLEPADSDGRHEYACAFTAAGRVKRSDQQPADWLIPAAALANAAHLYDARPSYLDHPDLFGFGWHQEPKVSRLIGVTFNPRWSPEEETVLGSLRLYDKAPGSPGHFVGALFDQILSDKAKGLAVPPIGLSAVFFHTTHLDEDTGLRITDAIDYVESVDVVYDPGAAGYVREALAALRPRTLTRPPISLSRRTRNARRTRSHHAARSNPTGPGTGPRASARARRPVGTRRPTLDP